MNIDQMPHLDERATTIKAGVDNVWPVLVEALDRAFSRAGMPSLGRTGGCLHCTASGSGRHGLSSYTLIFRDAGFMADKLASLGGMPETHQVSARPWRKPRRPQRQRQRNKVRAV
jgi:hypothetical protein